MDDAPNERKSSALRMVGKVIKGGDLKGADGVDASAEKPLPAPAPKRGGVLNAEEFEAKQTGNRIVAEAQQKAEEIIASAQAQVAEAVAKAQAEARAEVQAQAIEELTRAKLQAGQLIAQTEPQVLELALRVAAKIIGRDLERDPEVLLEIVATASEAARASKAMIFKVHPDDGRLMREKMPRLRELIGRAVDISVRDDTDVERNGCIIQTEFGTIDAQIRTQLDMLRNVLTPAEAKREVK